MKLHFLNLPSELEQGMKNVNGRIGIESGETGIPVRLSRCVQGFSLRFNGESVSLEYDDKSSFFRAIGLVKEHLEGGQPFQIEEKPGFRTRGAMADVSRNGVLKVETVRQLLCHMALMGFNQFMLYTEDTYEVTKYPYFGYMRGRYTAAELKEIDDFAFSLGIEIVPCIQTLAHLRRMLQWKAFGELCDTEDILLAGDPKVYEFLEDAIRAVSAPLRSRRIHIGMDEAHSIGRGRYLDQHGVCDRNKIFLDHLVKVVGITDKLGLRPMMWSDMFFRLAAGDYYAPGKVSEKVAAQIPKNLDLVYWDYYHDHKEEYKTLIEKHLQMSKNILFAGGVWTWDGLMCNEGKAFRTTIESMEACREESVEEVFTTMWGDNGAEVDPFQSLLGLQLFAEMAWGRSFDHNHEAEQLKDRFAACTGENSSAFRLFGNIDAIDRKDPENLNCINTSKQLLYQDPLNGLFDKHFEGYDLKTYYEKMAQQLKDCESSSGEFEYLFALSSKLCEILAIKGDLGIRLHKAYKTCDKTGMKDIAEKDIPSLIAMLHDLKELYFAAWHHTFKPFGFEVLDGRIGAVSARVETAQKRIRQYLSGEISGLEELEQEQLYFDGREQHGDFPLTNNNMWHMIVSACSVASI